MMSRQVFQEIARGVLLLLLAVVSPSLAFGQPAIPNAKPLEWEDDIASRIVAGADRFLLRELDKSVPQRAKYWKRDVANADSYNRSIESNRKRLAHLLGVRDARPEFDGLLFLGTTKQSPVVGSNAKFKAYAVRWPALRDIHGEGLLLIPTKAIGVDVVAIPDADQTPEMIAGIAPGLKPEHQFARRLAESGCRVVIPALIDRQMKRRMGNRAKLSSREFIYRSAYELGRHVIGYELQKTFAAIDWFAQSQKTKSKIGVIGWGEGGMLALYAGALDTRIDAVCVSGYFEPREKIWSQPISRNVFALLEQFGDAEVASMIAPRALTIDASRGPEVTLPGDGGGAPAVLKSPDAKAARSEFDRARKLVGGLAGTWSFVAAADQAGVSKQAQQDLFNSLCNRSLAELGEPPRVMREDLGNQSRQDRLIHEMDDHNQWLLRESPYVRAQFMNKLKFDSVENYVESAKWYRDFFREEVVGDFGYELLPPNVRVRKSYDMDKVVGYKVVLDVLPDVVAYGILLLPKDIKPGEKRPVVVCQHGLEGRPRDVVEGDHGAYHDYATKLAERGFVTFSPQNIYIFRDRFRTLQRKAYPLKKTIFSIMVPQHQQITDWLGGLPFVDKKRIAFYGLSYGGKSAMRIPPLVENYCLSICSADFNEWVWKNASSRSRYSYVGTGEYEIFEFDLGSTFNYAEMAALIAPRPFMVERGHFDGVAPDETVGYEFAKVRFLYEARLKLKDQCELEWFVGPHTINGKGTFDFLHKHLKWPK